MKFDVKLVNNDSERYWKCELGKKQAVISALIGFVGDDIKRDFVSATIAATLLTAVSYNWHFQRELNHEMFTTPVFRVKENQAIVPIRLFFESGVPSRFLRTFRQPPRPALRCGYPSSSVTSR